MSPLTIRRCARRLRRRRIVLAATLLVALSLAVHHTSAGLDHGSHTGMDVGAVAELCLGVFTAVGASVVAVAVGLIALRPWRPPATLGSMRFIASSASRDLRVRAGPGLLRELCVYRC